MARPVRFPQKKQRDVTFLFNLTGGNSYDEDASTPNTTGTCIGCKSNRQQLCTGKLELFTSIVLFHKKHLEHSFEYYSYSAW